MLGSRTLVVDSYAWIEYFLGSDKGKKVLEELRRAEEVITPSVVLAELAHKYFREGMD
ncbi:MAG: PIN domain-containing protein, partial [Candidatus Korarchaeota archaeon]|nr:PIN domain-containing protein [Candidatus Korarchaeota archaeon]